MKTPKTLVLLFHAFIMSMNAEIIYTNVSNSSNFTIVGSYEARARLGVTNNLNLEAGKQLIIHGINVIPYNSTFASYAFVRAVLPVGDTMELASVASGSGYNARWIGPILGPLTIQYGLNSTSSFYYDFEQTKCSFLFEVKDFRASEAATSNTPSTSVVVPANANGDVS